jgi:hypothetical protein
MVLLHVFGVFLGTFRLANDGFPDLLPTGTQVPWQSARRPWIFLLGFATSGAAGMGLL